MGNSQSSAPSFSRVRNKPLFGEYAKLLLSDIAETYETYARAGGPPEVNLATFEELFCHMFNDSSQHFGIFVLLEEEEEEVKAVEGGAGSDDDDNKVFSRALYEKEQKKILYGEDVKEELCNMVEFLAPITLLCADKMDKKLRFIFKLFAVINKYDDSLSRISRSGFQRMGQVLLSGIYKLFDVEAVDTFRLETVLDKILEGHYLRREAEKKHAELDHAVKKDIRDSVKAKRDYEVLDSNDDELFLLEHSSGVTTEQLRLVEMTYDEFVLLCCDSGIIVQYLALLRVCLESYARDKVLYKLGLEAATPFNDSAYEDFAANYIEKIQTRQHLPLCKYKVSDAINEEAYYGRDLSITGDMTVFHALEHFLLSSNGAVVVYDYSFALEEEREKGKSKREKDQLATQAVKSIYPHFDVIDNFTIMTWLIQCLPDKIQQKDAHKENRRMSIAHAAAVAAAAVVEHPHGTPTIGTIAHVKATMNRRRSTHSANSQKEWENYAKQFAEAPLRACFKHEFGAHNRPFSQPYSSMTLSVDSFLLDALLLVAKGYRNIPILSTTPPFKPTHVLTVIDVISCVRKYCRQFLGKMMHIEVAKSKLMREPFLVNDDLLLGTVFATIIRKDVDCAAVVDIENRIVGRVDLHSLEHVLIHYDEHKNHRRKPLGMPQLKEEYQSQRYSFYEQGGSTNLSCLHGFFSPIKYAEALGIHLQPFDFFGEKGKTSATTGSFSASFRASFSAHNDLREDAEEEESSSNSSSSEDEDVKKKKKGKKGVLAKGKAGKKGNRKAEKTAEQEEEEERAREAEREKATKRISRLQAKREKETKTAKQKADREEKVRKEKEEALRLDTEATLAERKRFADHLQKCGAVMETDTFGSVIEAMHRLRSSRVFVIDAQGFVKGVVCFADIAVELTTRFERTKQAEYSAVAHERSKEVCK